MPRTKILVVDDEEMIRFAFEEFLKDEGYLPLLAPSAEAAIHVMKAESPEIVFLDFRLPERDGLDLLRDIREIDPGVAVVLMTAFGTMDVVIKAMQRGAYEYLTKPLDLDRIRIIIKRILEGKRSVEALVSEEDGQVSELSSDRIVGKGPAMQEIFKMIGLLTTQEVTVLITGESGVGKELVARAIHENSPRRKKPFVAVNCGAMPESLLEAELFGYEKGAFTGAEAQKLGKFEVAGGGTIFLDEIGDLQLSLQVKLLRVLQERSFERIGGNTPVYTDARIMAATNKDLHEEVIAARFRKDLFYRLHLLHVQLPPLRERREDIPLLVEHFIRKANAELVRQVRAVTQEAMECLLEHSWPGNVRELENQIKRAMVMSREEVLPKYLFEIDPETPAEVPQPPEERLAKAASEYLAEVLKAPETSRSLNDLVMGIVERAVIQEALRQTNGNQVHAAELLGMHRSTFRKKKKDYGL